MTVRLRLLPATLLVAAVAVAEEPPAAPANAPEGSMPAAEAPAPATVQPADPAAAPGEMSPDGTYTIKSGDTLWDLSQRFLNNPWYWPKIWADNPAVENPHWIYPGRALRIRNGADGQPVDPNAQGPEADAQDDAADDQALHAHPKDVADLSAGSIGKTDSLGQDADLVTPSGRLVFKPQPMKVQVSSIVTDRELASAGVVTGSFEQKELLTTYDRVYVRFENPADAKIGQTFTIFRVRDAVIHPVSKQSFGYQTEIVGSVKIVGREGDQAVGEIGSVNGYVARGDRLGQAALLDRTIKPTANTKELNGVILATEIVNQTWIAENHVVFVDKGGKDGVQEGNTFDVVQSGDGLSQLRLKGATSQDGLPGEVVAELMVFDVREDASAAMVVKSVREVGIGDRVEMHPAPVLLPGAGGDAP